MIVTEEQLLAAINFFRTLHDLNRLLCRLVAMRTLFLIVAHLKLNGQFDDHYPTKDKQDVRLVFVGKFKRAVAFQSISVCHV